MIQGHDRERIVLTGEPMLVMMEMTGPFMIASPLWVVESTSMEEFSQLSVSLTRKLRN